MNYKLHLISNRASIFEKLFSPFIEKGFQTTSTEKFADAIDILLDSLPQIIIIDSHGSDLSAHELCISLKSLSSLRNSLVIIVSDMADDSLENAFFDAGADDFIHNPFRPNILFKRINARLKEPGNLITIVQNDDESLSLRINRDSYSVTLGNDSISLSRKEFELLFLMASHPDKMFKREELFRLVWNKDFNGTDSRTLDVHISRLRQKIGSQFISAQKGVGYRLLS